MINKTDKCPNFGKGVRSLGTLHYSKKLTKYFSVMTEAVLDKLVELFNLRSGLPVQIKESQPNRKILGVLSSTYIFIYLVWYNLT